MAYREWQCESDTVGWVNSYGDGCDWYEVNDLVLFEKEQTRRQAEIDALREYAGHGFKYGGSSSQITKMTMKGKQADTERSAVDARRIIGFPSRHERCARVLSAMVERAHSLIIK